MPRSACLVTLFAWQVVYGADAPAAKGASSGSGASITLAVGPINTNTGNLGTSSDTAPDPYSESETEVPLDLDVGVPGVLNLVTADGFISSSADSNVDGSPGSKTTAATGEVDNLSLNIAEVLGLFGTDPLISLEAPNVTAAVTIAGQGGSFTSNSSVSLTGLTLNILGASIDLSSINLANVPPNTGLDLGSNAVAGLSIILNETQTVGSAAGGYITTTNAIRIKLNAVNLGLVNVLNGDVILGHAEASQGADPDGDGSFSGIDGDGDGDGIPDAVEIANAGPGGDTDGDGVSDQFDLDSDNDGINDVIEAGGKDADGNGRQDASGDTNSDEDGDGIIDSVDSNDAVLGGGNGVALTVPDTDLDGTQNYVDLDSDNDGLSDLVESGQAPANDSTGVLSSGDTDGDGIDNLVDGLASHGDFPGSSGPIPDADNDGIPNAFETDSDNNGTPDINGTPYAGLDGNGDGRIDNGADADGDGIPNGADTEPGEFGGLANPTGDSDGDGISNEDEGSGLVDTDGDGVSDIVDGDSDGDGVPDVSEGADDFDSDGVANNRDLDSDNDGINDVIEGGGTDANGNGLQDASGDANPDEDGDGIVDSVDTNDAVAGGGTGSALPLPDTDGDNARDFLDLDSDNDTISDLVESGLGAADSDNDGIGEGADTDQDGLVASVDGLPGARGDANGSVPTDTDGDGIPNYIDPNSDGTGAMDIASVGNGGLDGNGDGKIDNATDTDGDGIPDVADDEDNEDGGLGLGLQTYAEWRNEEFSAPANTNPLVSGPDADPDGDGFTNAEEFAFGSDPENPTSVPAITAGAGGGGAQLSAVKDDGVYVFVFPEVSRDLQAWSSAPDAVLVTADQPALLSAQINSGFGGDPTRGFIRFHIIIP
ncbi:hypothetical protein OKA05_12215 [Luteolibacter arcticus]|uniref:Uncharacterized protein n=1 Tax=Luteolibacter arcticus TaxID=1581411 RepID=A0ABT3GII5_9BACT|nr:hypothetical protein [Luteolibacter arcticus]MCW1923320.1 hypothetical protein [Luteolibacter arcticus]